MVEDIYLIGYGFLRGFISGVLSRFGITISDMTLDLLAIVIGYYLRAQAGWKGVLGRVLFIGGLVSIGLEIGQATGRNVANEIFRAVPLQTAGAMGGASPQSAPSYWLERPPVF
jgi:uncharacterized membrane protein YbjE (DUF340 family)